MLISVLISAGISAIFTIAFQVYYRKQDNNSAFNLSKRIDNVELSVHQTLEDFSGEIQSIKDYIYQEN